MSSASTARRSFCFTHLPPHVYQAKHKQAGEVCLVCQPTTTAMWRWLKASRSLSKLISSAKWRLVLKRKLNRCCITIEFFQVVELSLRRKEYVDYHITWNNMQVKLHQWTRRNFSWWQYTSPTTSQQSIKIKKDSGLPILEVPQILLFQEKIKSHWNQLTRTWQTSSILYTIEEKAMFITMKFILFYL